LPDPAQAPDGVPADTVPRVSETPAHDSDGPKVKKRVGSAAMIEVGAYVGNIALRLGGNLVLTRLLVPEAFGLMALLTSVIVVLALLSEVGLSQSVVVSARGDEPKFLNTVFTLQALRGAMLWAVAAALAYPAMLFFREPDLLWIIPIGSGTVALHGFSSTRLYSLRRALRPAPVLLLDLFAYTLGLAVMIGGAKLGYGVKALVTGVLVTAAVNAFGSHFLPGTHRVRFGIDKDCQAEILSFGRWIFFSSCLTAVAQRGDQMLLGRLLGAAILGVYNIALNLAEMPPTLVSNVLSGALYPALARVKDQNDPKAFADTYYGVRRWLDPLAHVGIGGLAGMAGIIIEVLYDDRYQATDGIRTSYILVVLAVRASVQVLALSCEYAFIALGESKFSFRRNLYVSSVLVVSMPVGDWVAGAEGVLWASVLARGTALVALWPEARRRGFMRFSRELLCIPYLAVGYGLGTLATKLLYAVMGR
jgi:O-antigen/teichoic acid export membrane protein